MKRKAIVVSVAAAALVLAAVLFCALAPCVDGLTPFQSASVRRFLKNNPFFAADGDERVVLSVAAGVGTDGYARNTFVGSRIQMESEPNYIELNLAADASGRLVLADSYFEINEKSIDADRVARSLLENTKETSLLVNLSEYTDLNKISALVSGSSRLNNAVIRGVDEKTIDLVRGYFPSHTLLCEYSKKNKLTLAELKAKGVDGVCCPAAALSESFAEKVHEAGLLLWVDCGGSVLRLTKTMRLARVVDGLVTTRPALALALQRASSYEEYKQQNGRR